MRLLTTDGGVIESTRPRPLTVTEDAAPRAHEVHRPVIVPHKQQIAVLVVIPMEFVPSEIALRLGASGYAVQSACTGRAAVEVAEQTPPDIILLDLDGMYEISLTAKVSGFRVLHLLGRLRQEHPMAMVVMTRVRIIPRSKAQYAPALTILLTNPFSQRSYTTAFRAHWTACAAAISTSTFLPFRLLS